MWLNKSSILVNFPKHFSQNLERKWLLNINRLYYTALWWNPKHLISIYSICLFKSHTQWASWHKLQYKPLSLFWRCSDTVYPPISPGALSHARLISSESVVPYLGVRLEQQKDLETVNLELGWDWLRLNSTFYR